MYPDFFTFIFHRVPQKSILCLPVILAILKDQITISQCFFKLNLLIWGGNIEKTKITIFSFYKKYIIGLLLIEGKFVNVDCGHLLQVYSDRITCQETLSGLQKNLSQLLQSGWDSLSSLWEVVKHDNVFSVKIEDRDRV